MARHGVTYTEVAAAANQLIGQGRNPTIEQVRLILRTGSSTTIANHLKIWRDAQSDNSLIASKENIPDELIAIVKGLWERVHLLSDEKLQAITNDYQQILSNQQTDLDKYRHNNKRWQKLYNLWNKEKDSLIKDGLELKSAIDNLTEEHYLLESKYKLATQQLIEKHDRIQELHHLQQQSQKNLELFRETTREQRQTEQQKFDEQKISLETEIKHQREQNLFRQEETAKLQIQHHKMFNDYAILKAESDSQKTEYLHQIQHWQTQHHTQNDQLIEHQAQIKFLIQQLTSDKKVIKDFQDRCEQLEKEKLSLIQDKAELAGRIKQMDRETA